ncbi:Uncharacterized protein YR821_2498 [Yersinia ruckeri]|nr:hypothetical protein yruck0001_31930 [Yersinia ruckeri ATCC 29473]QTD77416.1 Uncharacterized protein YR821_2498 [Yersinia ruckeri]
MKFNSGHVRSFIRWAQREKEQNVTRIMMEDTPMEVIAFLIA